MSADPVHDKRGPGGQRPNVAIAGEWLRHAAEEVEADLTGRIWITRNRSAREQCFDLRRKPECPTVIAIVERLDTVGVASQE